jgi:cytochrome c biogenesis protein CcdA/thiol-disulfide isomerase/thioredoxin
MALSIVFAFLAGLVTVASPCILPILPIALSSSAARGRLRPLGVIVGLVVSFSTFTLAVSQLVTLIGLPAGVLRLAAVIIIALLGLGMIVPSLRNRLEGLFARFPGLAPKQQGSGWWGGLLTGAALGLVWAPCVGPVLAAITTLAATSRVTSMVVAVTAAYALGVGLPLLLIAYGGQAAIRRVPALSRRSLGIQRVFGGLMLVMALLIALNADVALTVWATSALPTDWNNRLQAFEDTPQVRARLDSLLGRTGTAAAGAANAGAGAVAAAPAGLTGVIAPSASPAAVTSEGMGASDKGGTMRGSAAVAEPVMAAPAAAATATAVPAQTATAIAAPTVTPARPAVALEDLGPASDFTGIDNWINSPALKLADLRGKVVLVDFWTYSCINCIRTLPYVTAWYDKYKAQGLVVVGVHTPEFAFEHEAANVQDATRRYHITYPVAQDNNYATWNAYTNLYWPAEYLIDAQGRVRHTHFGEGNYDETEQVIQELLAEAGKTVAAPLVQAAPVPMSGAQTPETYVGLGRGDALASPEKPIAGRMASYSLPAQLPINQFALDGQWTLDDEYDTVEVAGAVLRLHFVARDVYLVLVPAGKATVDVTLPPGQANHSEDVDAQGKLQMSADRLYHIASLDSMQESTVELRFEQPGVRVYAFTFGS